MNKFVLAFLLATIGFELQAQTDSAASLSLAGYAESYLCLDPGMRGHERASYIYSMNRANEVNVNLAYIRAKYNGNHTRVNLALAAGTYMNANLANEPGVMKNIYEASTGIRLNEKYNLWLDMGVMPSHIGFESPRSVDCPNLTRSMMADNSPYFETGARFSATSVNGKWYLALLALNGWQRIHMPEDLSTPSAGHQLTWKPNKQWTLNSSSFFGNIFRDNFPRLRAYHNFYAIYEPSKKFSYILGFDVGLQRHFPWTGWYKWYSPVAISQWHLNKNHDIALRLEYFNDPSKVMIENHLPAGFKTFSWSLDFDKKLASHAYWRIEVRQYYSNTKMYEWMDEPSAMNVIICTALAVDIGE